MELSELGVQVDTYLIGDDRMIKQIYKTISDATKGKAM